MLTLSSYYLLVFLDNNYNYLEGFISSHIFNMNFIQDKLKLLNLVYNYFWIDHIKIQIFATINFLIPTFSALYFLSKAF
jgi:hypothetical protein